MNKRGASREDEGAWQETFTSTLLVVNTWDLYSNQAGSQMQSMYKPSILAYEKALHGAHDDAKT